MHPKPAYMKVTARLFPWQKGTYQPGLETWLVYTIMAKELQFTKIELSELHAFTQLSEQINENRSCFFLKESIYW